MLLNVISDASIAYGGSFGMGSIDQMLDPNFLFRWLRDLPVKACPIHRSKSAWSFIVKCVSPRSHSTRASRSLREMDSFRFFFEPVQLGCQTADLSVKNVYLLLLVYSGLSCLLVRLSASVTLICTGHQLFAPPLFGGRMNPMSGGNVAKMEFLLKCFKNDL